MRSIRAVLAAANTDLIVLKKVGRLQSLMRRLLLKTIQFFSSKFV